MQDKGRARWQVPCIFLRLAQPRCVVTGDEIDWRPLVRSNRRPRTGCQCQDTRRQLRLTAGRHLSACLRSRVAATGDFSVARRSGLSCVVVTRARNTHGSKPRPMAPGLKEAWQVGPSDENAETPGGQPRIASVGAMLEKLTSTRVAPAVSPPVKKGSAGVSGACPTLESHRELAPCTVPPEAFQIYTREIAQKCFLFICIFRPRPFPCRDTCKSSSWLSNSPSRFGVLS